MRSAMARACFYVSGLALVVGVFALRVGAQAITGPSAPEIDGNSIATGLALASGAALILRSRRRTK